MQGVKTDWLACKQPFKRSIFNIHVRLIHALGLCFSCIFITFKCNTEQDDGGFWLPKFIMNHEKLPVFELTTDFSITININPHSQVKDGLHTRSQNQIWSRPSLRTDSTLKVSKGYLLREFHGTWVSRQTVGCQQLNLVLVALGGRPFPCGEAQC